MSLSNSKSIAVLLFLARTMYTMKAIVMIKMIPHNEKIKISFSFSLNGIIAFIASSVVVVLGLVVVELVGKVWV